MSRMTKKNLLNIKKKVEEQTGVEMQGGKYRYPVRRLAVLAAAVLCCCILAAFTYPLFSPLDGDALALDATYLGDGIVSIYVENGSDKDLNFQKQTKLYSWVPNVEIKELDGPVHFENTEFPAHSSGIMTVDLSDAYDMEELEKSGNNPGSYYLLLTNHNFLFGHDWICSFTFQEVHAAVSDETLSHTAIAAESIDSMEPELQFYFEDSYQDEVPAWNEMNFTYLQKVDELVKRFDGTVVPPVFPTMMVGGPSTMLDPQPMIRNESENILTEWSSLDGYRRLVGATASEKAWTISVGVSQKDFPDGVAAVQILYLFVYEAGSFTEEDYGFIYGRFCSFRELEQSRIYEDSHYVIFDVTDLIYTDLDAYLDDMQKIRTDLIWNQETRQEIRRIYENDRKSLEECIFYLEE